MSQYIHIFYIIMYTNCDFIFYSSYFFALIHFSQLLVVLFQIGLCLILKCTGVSIIWCFMAGWILIKDFSFILLIDLCAILYYTFTAYFITTVAHVSALHYYILSQYNVSEK